MEYWDLKGMGLILLGSIVLGNFLLKTKFGSLFFFIGTGIGIIMLLAGVYFIMFSK